MSASYYCHECEVRISQVVTPIATCSICGCEYIEQIPTLIDEPEELNRTIDFFCNYRSILSNTESNLFQQEEEEEDEDDDDEEMLEERCLYEQIASMYNHPVARNLPSGPSHTMDEILDSIINEEEEEEEEEEQNILAYDVLFEQRENEGGSTSAFQVPFARIGRLLETIYNRSDEESEEGDDYTRRSFIDNLAEIISEFTQDIETGLTAPNNSPPIDVILSSLSKKCLIESDPDVYEECIICQDTFGTTLEIFHLPCHHKFHGTCISRWLNINLTCPVCRQSVYDENTISTTIANDTLISNRESIFDQVD
ncbi:hypothetical protein BD770DRAFT_445912 [Pilaira anomala]|nr:hypothetical protein BD770DRAFT_445912 [Pilaira anomala]